MITVARGCTAPLQFSYRRFSFSPTLIKTPIHRTQRDLIHSSIPIANTVRLSFCERKRHQVTIPKLPGSCQFSSSRKLQSWWAPMNPPTDKELEDADLEIKPMNEEDISSDDEKVLTRRIHILGVGSIGALVAHSLKCLPNPPPVTLLMHRQSMYEEFKEGSRIVRLVNKKTEINDEQTGYDVDLIEGNGDATYWRFIPDIPDVKTKVQTSPLTEGERMENGEVFIYTLVVSVKGPATISALKSIKHRLDSRSTILFMQNGLGQIDALNSQVFTDPETRPTYMIGIISHGAFMQGPFAVVHAGFGAVALGISRDADKYPYPPRDAMNNASELSEEERKKMFPTDKELYSNLSARYLLRTLTRSPVLACAPFPYLDLFQLQLEKLVTNCVINPLTALLDVQNGYMLISPHLTHVQRLMIAEISIVLRGLPELEGVPNVRLRFSSKYLEARVKAMAKKTAANSSSMREDVRHMKNTEIDYLNGYIVRRGEEQGIKCVLNYLICELIKGKTDSQHSHAQTGGTFDFNRFSSTTSVEADINPKEIGQSSLGVTLEDRSKPRG